MDFLDEVFGVEELAAPEHPLYAALCGEEARAVRLLQDLEQPLEGRDADCCLRKALECSPELFLRVLEHCEPGEHAERYILWADGKHRFYILGQGSLLLLAAMMDRPQHVRLLLERGYDCNGAGLEIAYHMAQEHVGGTVPYYGKCCGVQGSSLHVYGRQEHQSIVCATPLAAALLCGSLGAAAELLHWPGVWKGESSAVCRAVAMVLEGVTWNVLSEKRQKAQWEILRQIFCPEQKEVPGKETLLRTCYLQPAAFVDLCGTQTLRCQLESGLCGEEDARQMLDTLERRSGWGSKTTDRTKGGKLLLLKRFFPEVCRQPWATGIFLREILWRCSEKRPYQTLLKAWKQLCGKERDLTWMSGDFWEIGWRDLRRFLEEAGEGGTLVMDEDAVSRWFSPHLRGVMELLNRVRFRHREERGISGLMQHLLGMSNLRVLQHAAKRGLLSREDPAVLMEHLMKNPQINHNARSMVLTYARKQGAQGDNLVEKWQDPQRWEYWCTWAREEEVYTEELHAVLYQELSREECLRGMFRLNQYLRQDFLSPDISVEHPRYPSLQTNSLTGIACCAERGQAMGLLLEHLPGRLRQGVQASWGDRLYFRGTPLCLSAALGRMEQVRLLLEAGADPDEADRGGASQFIIRRKDFSADITSVTPLLAAILFGEEETARLLLAHGAVCDFSRPAYRKVLQQGSAASLVLAESLPGVGFEKIPEEELEALRIATGENGARTRFWMSLEAEQLSGVW